MGCRGLPCEVVQDCNAVKQAGDAARHEAFSDDNQLWGCSSVQYVVVPVPVEVVRVVQVPQYIIVEPKVNTQVDLDDGLFHVEACETPRGRCDVLVDVADTGDRDLQTFLAANEDSRIDVGVDQDGIADKLAVTMREAVSPVGASVGGVDSSVSVQREGEGIEVGNDSIPLKSPKAMAGNANERDMCMDVMLCKKGHDLDVVKVALGEEFACDECYNDVRAIGSVVGYCSDCDFARCESCVLKWLKADTVTVS